MSETDAFERHLGPAAKLSRVDQAEPAGKAIEEQVLGQAHDRKEIHLLEHHHDPGALGHGARRRGMRAAAEDHPA